MSATESNKTVIRTPRSESKTAKAEEMFNSMPGVPRSTLIQKFTAELGLTAKGASTYYQTMRKRAGMTTTRHGGAVMPKAAS